MLTPQSHGDWITPSRSPRTPARAAVAPSLVLRVPLALAPEIRASCPRSIHHPARVLKPP